MTRSVVILGFPGVQALDLVGPHDVFTGAAALTEGGYRVRVVSADGQPRVHRHRPGLRRRGDARTARHRHPGDPRRLRASTPPARTPATMAWIAKAVAELAPGGQRVHRGVPGRAGRSARRSPRDHPLGVRRPAGPRVPRRHRRPRADLRAQHADGVDGRWRHRGHRPRARARRGGLRHRGRADRRPLAGALPAPPGRADPVRRAGVDAARQARADPRGAGRHRVRHPVPHTTSPSSPAAPR